MKRCLVVLLNLAMLSFSYSALGRVDDRPNVLFIAIDDLNHWVGHLGRHCQAKTPNIDRLASEGVTFTRAYCTAPACNPSRVSIMSGKRPSTTGCYLNGQKWRVGISEDILLNSHFARAGYRIYGAGKIYHRADQAGHWDDYFVGKERKRRHPDAKNGGVGGIRFVPLANTDDEMVDYRVVSYGIEKLQEEHSAPFFLAIGLVKPHMPFSVPKKYFDMFPLDTIQLPPHQADDLDDIPPAGVKMAKPEEDHAQMVASGRWKEAVQAYLATVAFCDAQVGRLLEGLEKSPYRENTIVCLWSDHGWSLGEKSHWRKFALWEEPTRTVFVWKAPGITKPSGVSNRAVDYTTIYPTLCDLAGIEQPEHLEGISIVPLLRDPKAAWERPAITTYGYMNHSVRSDSWRYIRYADGSEELYDETADPFEYTNLADDPLHETRKTDLAKWLPSFNATDLPAKSGGRARKSERRVGRKPD